MKIKQSESREIERSKINFAPYNPRLKDEKVVESLIKNFKKVGFLGGIVWNEQTGNLVSGHKRLEALDCIYKYLESGKEYLVKVEVVNIDLKTEKSQNIYFNNKKKQGQTDFDALSLIVNEIDIDLAGIDESDIELIEALVPDFEYGDKDDFKLELNEESKLSLEEKKESIKSLKKDIKNSISDAHLSKHFSVSFSSYNEKAEFLESVGINGDEVVISSKTFFTKILNDNQ